MPERVNYNPDILSCLANLSNDEVFTPPEIVNAMLDMVPQELFSDPNAKFLDPTCKSGVFLREIVKRLNKGLETTIPDREKRMEHIFRKQVFGVSITELTALLSRRSVYCSKDASCRYSIAGFPEKMVAGNIRYQRMDHTWENGNCVFCGAPQEKFDRGIGFETYAYEFIHETEIFEVFKKMKFDLIISNPPYQIGSNDSRSTGRDKPIYNLFVEKAKKLNPRYLVMIIPSRWMATGLGLNSFRSEMLSDSHIRSITDYPVANDVFPGVEIKGGVCYFLRDRENSGPCCVTSYREGKLTSKAIRSLNEFDIFVRDSLALPILHKILQRKEKSIISCLSVDKEFGWTSNFSDFSKSKMANAIPLYYNSKGKRLFGWIDRKNVMKSQELIDTYKVMVPKAGSDGGKKIPNIVLGKPFIVDSPSVCTQTYLFFYGNSRKQAENILSYVCTKFFRFLVSLRKMTQDATRSTYTWVPLQDFSHSWTDEMLFGKYQLTDEEIRYIDYLIRPMDLGDED